MCGTTCNLNGVCFINADTGTVVGDEGTILFTTNGGVTWRSQSSDTRMGLNGICSTEPDTWTTVGMSNTILRREAKANAIESRANDDNDGQELSALKQNYPNPFNPTTTIQFTIVNRQSTIVKVFDLLGREVTTLVDEVKSPGTYTVEFDGSKLASGVYFYRLQAGDFVQAKKLVILK
jgi:hypothetical protein